MNSDRTTPTTGEGPRSRPWRAAAGVMMGSVVSLLALGGTGSVAGAQNSTISVTVEAGEDAATCAPRGGALRHGTENSTDTFTLVVTADRQLCEPVTAVAAVYAMPGNGVAWPQRLVERREFVIGSAGTYRITFDKTCQPAQFDVLTGDTPATIAPWGAQHGPLLFPYDLTTALQHWGSGCAQGTTTSAPPGTTPPSTQPTVAPGTVAPTVVPPTDPPPPAAPETSTPGGPEDPDPGGEVSPTDDAEVLGISTPNTPGGPPAAGSAQDPADASPAVAGLAFTGVSSIQLALAGLVMLASGVATLLHPRMRSRRYWAYL